MHEDLVPRLRELADDGYLLHTSTGEALRESADAIEELTVMLDAANDEATALYGALPRWIRVEEAQPTSQGPFFTRYGFGAASRETGQYFFGARYYLFADLEPHWQDESLGVEVTHWMPIPPVPEEAENDD